MTDLLFVYGTLMRGHDNPMSRLLADLATYAGPGTVRGKLFLVKTYPGLVESPDDADIVHGELFAGCGDGLIAKLDEYEGCGPADSHPQQYRRSLFPVTRPSGDTVEAWVYLFNWPTAGLTQITSGRFGMR